MNLIASEGGLVIRRMRDVPAEHERMARWRNQLHVREWWGPDDPPLTPDGARRKYGPRTRADAPATACVIEFEGRAVGYIQFYPWAAFREEAEAMGLPEVEGAWGLDVFVGEPDLIDRGVGSAAVDLLCRYLFDQRLASRVMLAAAVDNARALSAYEKAGFARTGRVLDTDTKDGRRVESWLLIRTASTTRPSV
jgi:aminoglycoside 6'-N-acetyltransferase